MIRLASITVPSLPEDHEFIRGNGFAYQLRQSYPYYFGIRRVFDRYDTTFSNLPVSARSTAGRHCVDAALANWLNNRFSAINVAEMVFVDNQMLFDIDEQIDHVLYRGVWFRHQTDAALFRLHFE